MSDHGGAGVVQLDRRDRRSPWPRSTRPSRVRPAPRPRRSAGGGTSRLSGSGRWSTGSCPMIVSAAARIRAPERKFVYRGSRAAGLPSASRERRREPEQVVERRAAPRVDVLVGVADRGDRVAVAEQRCISSACATFVSWYSSSSTARNRARWSATISGYRSTTSSARSIWSPKSITPSSRFSSR